jgi:hypothetical protein
MKNLKQTEEPGTNSAPVAQLRVYDNGTASKFLKSYRNKLLATLHSNH